MPQIVEALTLEDISLSGDEIHFHDLDSGEERSPVTITDRILQDCLNALMSWPAMGGIQIKHPKISMGVVLELFGHTSVNVDYINLSMRYSTKDGEQDENQLFSFACQLFSKVDRFGLLFGESPEHTQFRPSDYSSFVEALEKVQELQLKKVRNEKGFFEKIILTRSLNTTFSEKLKEND